jgi:hypothetical protein
MAHQLTLPPEAESQRVLNHIRQVIEDASTPNNNTKVCRIGQIIMAYYVARAGHLSQVLQPHCLLCDHNGPKPIMVKF